MNQLIIEINETNQIRIAPAEFRNKYKLDIRQFFKADSGEWLPTKKGCAIPAEHMDAFVKFVTAQATNLGAVKEGKKPRKSEYLAIYLKSAQFKYIKTKRGEIVSVKASQANVYPLDAPKRKDKAAQQAFAKREKQDDGTVFIVSGRIDTTEGNACTVLVQKLHLTDGDDWQ